jgi:hypothetical protein
MPSKISSTPQMIPHLDDCFINAAGVVTAIAMPFRRSGLMLSGAIGRVAAHCGRDGPDAQGAQDSGQKSLSSVSNDECPCQDVFDNTSPLASWF